jgi:hypothetical protein
VKKFLNIILAAVLVAASTLPVFGAINPATQILGFKANTDGSGSASGVTVTGTLAASAVTATSSMTAPQFNGNATTAGTAGEGLPTFDCTQASGAMTFSSSTPYLAFRNASLTNGTPSVVTAVPANLVLASGGTLGVPTTLSGRIYVVEMNNTGTREIAITNNAGGLRVDEENLISTTAIGAGSTANNVWYSTSARSNLPYRIIGACDAVNTGGAWASPTTKINAGGNALTAMSSLGYGQTWQTVTRTSGTTYYATFKPIQLSLVITTQTNGTTTLTVNGVLISTQTNATAGVAYTQTFTIPAGAPYVITNTTNSFTAAELR